MYNVVNSFFSIILQRQNLPTSNLCHLDTSLPWVSLMLQAIIHITLLSVTLMLTSSLAHVLTSEALWANVLYRAFILAAKNYIMSSRLCWNFCLHGSLWQKNHVCSTPHHKIYIYIYHSDHLKAQQQRYVEWFWISDLG